MRSWAAEELSTANLGDARLNKRLVRMVEAFSAQPDASVPQASGAWAATKATYRFWGNPRVTPQNILQPHITSTIQRLRDHPLVLVAQDTTGIDLTDHPATQGTGYLDHPDLRGFKVHSALAIAADGVPLGVLHQQTWTRDLEDLGKSRARRRKEIHAKESQRWLTGLEAIQRAVPADIRVIIIGDRESDIFDLFAAPRRPGAELLVRVARENRRVEHPEKYLADAVGQSPPQGDVTIEVPRCGDRPARLARLTIRWVSVPMLPPRHHPQRAALAPIRVQVILAEEEHPPPWETPVRWLLVTTLPVLSFRAAVQCLRWYTYRWRVERLHYVLKSGCRIEERELETVEGMERALATYTVVAWRLLWLTYAARQDPEAPCAAVLETHEWQALHCAVHKTAVPPSQPPSLREAVRLIARLGGFLARTGDGEPGVKTLWRGLRRLDDIAETWKLAHAQPSGP
jgi:hypothetical protein